MANLHVGDIGVLIRLTVTQDGSAKNVSAASTKEITWRKPSGEWVVRTATFTATGSDGQIQAATVLGDLDEEGTYQVAAHLVLGSWSGHSGASTFEVRAVGA